MEEINYAVSLHAPLGERPGELTLWIENGTVRGELSLLQKITKLAGMLKPDGSLAVTGELITHIRKIPYSAEGKISGDGIELTLHSGQRVYELTGIKKERKEEER